MDLTEGTSVKRTFSRNYCNGDQLGKLRILDKKWQIRRKRKMPSFLTFKTFFRPNGL